MRSPLNPVYNVIITFFLTKLFDNTVDFEVLSHLPAFYKEAFQYFHKAHVSTLETFKDNISRASIWGNKFITQKGKQKKKTLFFIN